MRLLLDTHIWLWTYLEPQRLGSEVAREITDPLNDRFLSPVSIWEVILLLRKGRVELRTEFTQWLQKSIEDLELTEAPVTWQVAHALGSLKMPHNDPADWFLVATAKVYDLTLVTADHRLMNLSGLRVLPNH